MNEIPLTREKYDLSNIHIPSILRRFGAFLIDIFCMFAISFGIVMFLVVIFDIIDFYNSALFFFIWLTLFAGYFPILEYFYSGQTIGRKITGLRLVRYTELEDKINLDYEGKIPLMKLFLRNFLKLVWYMPAPIIFALIAFVLMYDDKLHRVFYDKVLKTIVIQI